MKFTFLKAAGFRGINEPLEISFPSGFVVISGRNGTGKSSICDAIEYALTGAITKYSQTSEKGEDVADYLWWRGDTPAEHKYVILGLMDSAGREITVTRRPDGMAVSDGADLRSILCDSSVDADKTLGDICRTSIVRDELITQLSVDLAEAERFNFVRMAVGSASFASTEAKLADARKIIDSRILRTKQEYERARDRVKDLLTEISKAQAEATRTEDAAQAESSLRLIINKPQADVAEVLAASRKLIPEKRLRVDALSRLSAKVDGLLKRERDLLGVDTRDRQVELQKSIEAQAASLALVQQQISNLDARLKAQQGQELVASSLAQLHEHGSRVGLEGGHCPLCGSEVSEVKYREHLAELRIRLAKTAEAATVLVKERAALNEQESKANGDLTAGRRQADQLSMLLESFNRERDSALKELEQLGIKTDAITDQTVAALTGAIESSGRELRFIEKNVAVLEASKVHVRLAELQKDLAASQAIVVGTEKRIAKQEAAEQRIKRGALTLKRVSAEIVDDRLAAIRPLLAELYVRLRPHVDWPEISYVIRGDTRRFLSLRVGDGLNLRYMFSSGQRRAAGLAFLMAVSLSRPWCRLDSLIFDDPVQHIDDFRALHLVETLSALRQVGRQIMCTVEDSALAELLVRRLRSSAADEGMRLEMEYESGRGVFLGKVTEIRPFSTQILRSA